MYRWTETKDISRGVERLEELRVLLDHAGVAPRAWSGRIRRELQAEAVAASTMIEGVPVTVDEVRHILAGDRPSDVSEHAASLVEGYRDAMTLGLARVVEPDFTWDAEFILGLHRTTMVGSWAVEAGRVRPGQNVVMDGSTGERRYLPPPPDEVAALLDELGTWLQETTSAAPIAAALAHVSLAGIHPFRDGNGRVARILASLVMARGGFRRQEFTSLEEWWGRHISDYYGAFRCLGETWDPDSDATPFVAAHVGAQVEQVEVLAEQREAERELWIALENVASDMGLDVRVADALLDVAYGRTVTNRYYRSLTGVSAPTAASDLSALVAAGLLAQTGAGRSTAYTAGPGLFERLEKETGVRVDASAVPGARGWALLAALADRLHERRG